MWPLPRKTARTDVFGKAAKSYREQGDGKSHYKETMHSLKIPCAEEHAQWGYSLEIRYAASCHREILKSLRHHHAEGKTGEKLVQAVLDECQGKMPEPMWGNEMKREVLHSHAKITGVYYERYGKRNNGPDGEPHSRSFHENGALYRTLRCVNGKREDGPNGEGADIQYYKYGGVREIQRYLNDKLSNGANGEPQRTLFYANGLLEMIEYRDPAPPGVHSMEYFDKKGDVISVNERGAGREYNAVELAQLNTDRQAAREARGRTAPPAPERPSAAPT